MRLWALITLCVIFGVCIYVFARSLKVAIALNFGASIFLFIIFDAQRLHQYLVPRPVLDMLLEPLIYEVPPWVIFAFLPMALSGLLARIIRHFC